MDFTFRNDKTRSTRSSLDAFHPGNTFALRRDWETQSIDTRTRSYQVIAGKIRAHVLTRHTRWCGCEISAML